MNCLGPAIIAAHLGKTLDKEFVDLMSGAQRKPEFLAVNPMHCVPAFKTPEGFSFWEGNVICTYLANGSALIPSDRTMMDLALAFRGNNIYKVVAALVYPIFGWGTPLTEETKAKAQADAKEVLDVFFSFFAKDNGFAAGSNLTAADFQIYPLLKGLVVTKSYPEDERINAYLAKFEATVPSTEGEMAAFLGFAASKV